MRDYIAELLREQEEEEEERRKRGERIDGAPPLSRLRRQLPRQGGAGAGEETPPLSQPAADSSPAGGELVRAGGLAARRELRGEGFSAAWADRALRASLTALPAPRGENRVTVLRPPEGGKTAWDPEGLDRAFRRDARRFDGGFSLL